MNSLERSLTAFQHMEADRVPFDLGGSAQSGIHLAAYARLRRHIELPAIKIAVSGLNAQTARLDEDFLDRLQVDTRFVSPSRSGQKTHEENRPGQTPEFKDEGGYWSYTDEWEIGWQMPKEDGFYFDMFRHPFDVDDVKERMKSYHWPDPLAPGRFEGLRERARAAHEAGKLVVLGGFCPGIVEMYSWLRGFPRFYTDLAAEPQTAEWFLDKMVELKTDYWGRALEEAGKYMQVINEADDVAGQNGLLISPHTYRKIIKPRHRQLFSAIKREAPGVKIFLHSCGAVRPLIPDFIEIGVDILNPIQVSAKGMNPYELKRDFGKDLVFWGGGVDTQRVFGTGSPEEVRDNVRRNIEALAPGGGYIFATVHNTQSNVPPENFMAMWETLHEYGKYS